MSDNPSTQTLDKEWIEMLKRHDRELQALKGTRKVMIIPVLTADPASPYNGQVWYNSTSGVFKKRQNGVTKNWETA